MSNHHPDDADTSGHALAGLAVPPAPTRPGERSGAMNESDLVGGGRARAEVLLEATNRFLVAEDVEELGETIITVVRTLFDPWTALLSVIRSDGRRQVVAASGYSAEALARVRRLLERPDPVVERVARGDELWSDAPGAEDFRGSTEAYGARSAFHLPIFTSRGVVGSLAVSYDAARLFEDAFREAVRSLCAQAGLALELISTRDELRRQARALEDRTRTANALFAVSQELANVSDPGAIATTLARAIREATGATYSVVGVWDAAAGRFGFAATEGFRPEHRDVLAAIDADPQRFRMIRGGIEGRANVRVPPFDPADVPLALVDALGVTAIAGSAVVVGDRPWGFVAVGTVEGDPDIVATGAELLAGIASIASSAIGRAEATAALARQAAILESSIAERTVQLRQAVDELRVANEAKTQMLTNVSHELRTPLTAILGFAEVLLQELDGPLTPEQVEDVRTIDQSAHHLLALIEDLIDVSAIDAGRVDLDIQPVALEPLLSGVVDEMRPLASEKVLELAARVGDDIGEIPADRARLHEILLNLLGNAIKFTPEGGRVDLTASRSADGITIAVTDTGIGIAPEHQGLVFDTFRRFGGPEFPGTGLGLSISQAYARMHGGSLTVDSALGQGTTFTLRLPVDGPGPGGAGSAGG